MLRPVSEVADMEIGLGLASRCVDPVVHQGTSHGYCENGVFFACLGCVLSLRIFFELRSVSEKRQSFRSTRCFFCQEGLKSCHICCF